MCESQTRDSITLGGLPQSVLFFKTVGIRPEINVKIGEFSVMFLVDTGSQVTTISEACFKDKLSGNVDFCAGKWFPLSAANGIEISYLGVALVDLVVFDTLVKQVLVVKDTPASSESRNKVPGILGTNVLHNI